VKLFRQKIVLLMIVFIGLPLPGRADGRFVIQDNDPFSYVYMPFRKALEQSAQARDTFLKECRKQGIQTGEIFMIVFDSHAPSWGIGFFTDKKLPVKPPLKSGWLMQRKVARMSLAGNNDNIYHSVTQFLSYINDRGYDTDGPMLIFLPDNSYSAHDNASRMEIMQPVRKNTVKMISQVFLLLSAFICLFLAFFLLTYSKRRTLSNMLFAGLLVSYALGRIDWLIQYRDIVASSFFLHINYIGDAFFVLVSPFLLLYTQSLTHKNFRLAPAHLIHLIPFVLLLGEVLARYSLFDADTKISLLRHSHTTPIFPRYEKLIINGIADIQKYSYQVFSLVILARYRKNLKKNHPAIGNIRLRWLSNIILGFLVIETLSAVKHGFQRIPVSFGEIFVQLVLLSYLFLFIYILYKSMQHNEIFSDTDNLNGKQKWTLPDYLFDTYLERLKICMETEKPYLNPLLTVEDLAEKLSIPPRYLSIVINKAYQQNFYNFINAYRIKAAQKLLMEDGSGMNILNVLYEAGFNSKSVFNDCFRKQTGLTPTEYRKSLISNN
jgi:AraC-like DNA-binding protein